VSDKRIEDVVDVTSKISYLVGLAVAGLAGAVTGAIVGGHTLTLLGLAAFGFAAVGVRQERRKLHERKRAPRDADELDAA
jgi:hypothetical protein